MYHMYNKTFHIFYILCTSVHDMTCIQVHVALQREKYKKLLHVQVQYPVTGTPLSVSSQRTL